MKPHTRPSSVLLPLGCLSLLSALPLAAAVTATDDGSAGTPYFSVSQSSVSTGFPTVLGNDINADGVIAVESLSAANAIVSFAGDGVGSYDPRTSGDARALGAGESLLDTFTYTATEVPPTPGGGDVLDPTRELNSLGWTGLPAAVAATGTNRPAGIALAHALDGSAGANRADFDGAQSNADASFEFWIRPDVVDANQTLFETGGSGTGSGVFLNPDGTVSFLCKSGGNPFVQSGTALTAGTWYHIVVVYEIGAGTATDTFTLYIDGVSEGSATDTTANDWSGSDDAGLGQVNNTSAGDNVDIDGVAGNQSYGTFTGQIGLMRHFPGKALSPTEVADNFAAANSTDTATVTVEITGLNDRPNALDDQSGSTLEDASLVSTASLVANDGPVRFAPFRASLNYDAAAGLDGTTWRNIGLLQPTGGDLSLTNATLDTSPGSARPGISAAIDFDDTTGGNAVLLPPPGTAINDFPQNLDQADATFEFWAKLHPDDLTQITTLFETGGGTGVGIVVDNGVLKAASELDGATMDGSYVAYDLTDPGSLVGGDPTAEFNHYVVTLDLDGGLELFVNGVSVAATTSGVAPAGDWDGGDNTGIGRFGGSNHGGFINGAATTAYDTSFKGSLASFRLYGGILTGAQITSAFNAVAEPETEVLYANYDASVAGTTSSWPNLGFLQPGANGGVINFSGGVTLDTAPGSARARITRAYDFPAGGGGSGVMSVNAAIDGLNEFTAPGGPIDEDDLSFEFWVKLDALDLGQISTLFEAGGGAGVGVVVDNGVVKAATNLGLGEVSYDVDTDPLGLLTTPGDPTDEFFQVVYSSDLTNDLAHLYINGTLVDSAEGNTSGDMDGGDGAGIGRFGEANHGGFTNSAGGTAYDTTFRGSMAIFRIYGGALNEAQVRQNYLAVDAGTDVDGDTLSVSGIFDGTGTLQGLGSPATLASGAIATLDSATGAFTYDPNGQFAALPFGSSTTDTFTYQVSDGNGGTGVAEVTVTILGVPDNAQPTADNATQTTAYSAGATNVDPGTAILVGDPNNGINSLVDAQFLWDGTATTFPGGGGPEDNDFNAPTQSAPDGFGLRLTFVPDSADLQVGVTAPVYEMGGTSNGHGIYLYDGIPHLLVKMQGTNADLPSGLNDPDWDGNVVSVPLTASALAADELADLSLIFRLDEVRWSINGGAPQTVALTNRDPAKDNWHGNLSVSIGIRGSSGNNGGTRQDGSGLFAYPTLSDLVGVVPTCDFWNASADDTIIIDPDIVTATLTMNPAEGGLSVPSGASFDGTTWTYAGTAAQVTHALGALQFLPNGTTPVDVAVDLRDGLEDGTTPVTGTLTFLVASALEQWRLANGFSSDGSGPNEGDGEDFDFDSLANLLEFGFGTDPTTGDNLPLNPNGSVNGTPTTSVGAGPGGVTFNALFIRRDDFGQSGSVSYTVEFSGDLVTFFPSTAPVTPGPDSTDDPDYHVASVPYPTLLPNGQKARYFRVVVTVVP